MQPGTTYVRQAGYYAIRDLDPKVSAPKAMFTLDEGSTAIYRGDPMASRFPQASGRLGPVYSVGEGGTLAVPTGLIFIRFKDGIRAEDRRQQVEHAGYRFVEVPHYAPSAAWVRSDDIAQSLHGLAALEALPDVESVEPQMLMRSTRR